MPDVELEGASVLPPDTLSWNGAVRCLEVVGDIGAVAREGDNEFGV